MHATLLPSQYFKKLSVHGGIQSDNKKLHCTKLCSHYKACSCLFCPLATPARTAVMVFFVSKRETWTAEHSLFFSGVMQKDTLPLAGTDETIWKMHGGMFGIHLKCVSQIRAAVPKTLSDVSKSKPSTQQDKCGFFFDTFDISIQTSDALWSYFSYVNVTIL